LRVAEKTEEKAMEVCPLCGSKMEKGVIGVGRGIVWSKEKHTTIWKRLFGNDIIVRAGWAAANLEAYRCRKCKLVIFRYGEANPAEASP
jgi:hypothetical protein